MVWKVLTVLGLALCAMVNSHAISEQKVVRYYGKIEHIGEKVPEHHEEYAWAYPAYEFSYKVDDPHTHDIKGQEESRDGDQVKGVYWLIQPDGRKRTVTYHSNKHDGFKAHVEYSDPHHEHIKHDEHKPHEKHEVKIEHAVERKHIEHEQEEHKHVEHEHEEHKNEEHEHEKHEHEEHKYEEHEHEYKPHFPQIKHKAQHENVELLKWIPHREHHVPKHVLEQHEHDHGHHHDHHEHDHGRHHDHHEHDHEHYHDHHEQERGHHHHVHHNVPHHVPRHEPRRILPIKAHHEPRHHKTIEYYSRYHD